MAQSQIHRSVQPPSYVYQNAQVYPPPGSASRLPSQTPSMNSYGVPRQQRSYPGVTNTHGSVSKYNSGHYGQGSTIGGRSHSRTSLQRQSKSLGASKASIASQRSGKSSIRQEYHDKQVRSSLLAPFYGKGRTPFLISVGLFIIGCLFIIGGGVIFGLRFHNNIMLSVDKGEIIGPLLIAVGILCYAGAIKFYYDAYRISNIERRKIKFTAANESMITISTVGSRNMRQNEPMVSGTASDNAVTRTPQGSSRSTLTQV